MSIKQIESGGGEYCVQGKSGESGCYQFLKATYEAYSKEIIGYVAPMTEGNEDYIVMGKVQKWLDQGYSASDIFRFWNQGMAGRTCKRGVNSYGVKYDSCKYVEVAMNHYKAN